MTPKVKTVYRCSECGADHPKWAGKCDVCGEWNTLVEEMAAPKVRASTGGGSARRVGGTESLLDYQREKNAASLDGLPAVELPRSS